MSKKARKVKVVTGDDDHEASEAECALHLLRMGFKIVRKNSDVPASEEELLAVIRTEAEARARKKHNIKED